MYNKRLLAQLFLFLMPMAFASVLMADETEIYFADKSGDVAPNVLFLIDGSGSMEEVVTGDSAGRTRMQILKDSFDAVMTAAPSNLNVGLMHYANHGLGKDYWWSSIKGVNFPATNIDAKVEPLISTYKSQDNLPNPTDGNTTVREFLSSVVNDWQANGYTPIVDSLYEASRYFRGEPVKWGLGHPSIGWAAHPLTYDSAISCTSSHTEKCNNTWGECNSNIVSGSCSSQDYNVCCNWVETAADGSGYCVNNDYSCATPLETCTHNICDVWSGAPSYQTPIKYKCQANYLVLMSDGKPEYPYYPSRGDIDGTRYYPPSVQNPAATEIDAVIHTAQIKVTQKIPAYLGTSCVDKPFGYASGTCGSELTHWLASTDQNPTLEGDQFVDTYAVAFAMSDQPQAARDYLASLVTKDGGFFNANSADELAGAFSAILNDVDKSAMSFASPTYTVDQNTLLSHSNDVYIPMFASDSKPMWAGNVKKFHRDEAGQIVDNAGTPVLDEKGQFLDTATDLWSSQAGADVTVGGAANQLPAPDSRHLYTDVSSSADLTSTGNALKVENKTITDAMLVGINEVTNAPKAPFLPDANNDGISCAGYYYDCDGNQHVVSQLGSFFDQTNDGCVTIADVPTTCPGGDYLTDDERTALINFSRGEDADGNPRNHMGDILNTKPLVLTYGSEQRVYVATNEGFLHSLDAETGVEEWGFMPKSLLSNIRIFYANEPSNEHVYGLDGPVTPWLVDWNGNGKIETGTKDYDGDGKVDDDKAYLFFGLRQGGKAYYALDVSNPDKPIIAWKKENVDGVDDGPWDELGESWSKPTLAKMRTGSATENKLRDVLVFGAGYDPAKEIEDVANRPADSVGRDVMIVDALSGELLWSLKRDVFAGNPDRNPVKDSVPGDIRVMDMDRNGALDRLYFADTGGNVWRVDMDHDLRDQDESLYNYGDAILTKIASLGLGGGNTTDPRKFFYEPDTALIQHNGQTLMSIALGSGYRSHPMNTAINDRFYVLMDPNVYNEPPDDFVPLTDADLTDHASTTLTDTDNLLHGNHKGWYYDFDLSGEKVLAPAVTFLNKVVFTTFAPVDEDGTGPSGDPCDIPPNSARSYVLDLFTGKAVANLDRSLDDSKDEFVVSGVNEILNSAQIVFRAPEYETGSDGELVCKNDCQQTVEIRVGKMSLPLMDESNSDNASGKVSESTDLSSIIPRIFWRDNSVSISDDE